MAMWNITACHGRCYVDRDSIYRCDRESTIAEKFGRKRANDAVGRAMEELGVKVIMAHSPQAKGRVERVNGTLQDRLVKALRAREDQRLGGGESVPEEEISAGVSPAVCEAGGPI